MADAFPSNGTDEEKRAWADRQTSPSGAPSSSPAIKAKPAYTPKTPEQQADEVAKRKGGYIREDAKPDHWWQTSDGHQ